MSVAAEDLAGGFGLNGFDAALCEALSAAAAAVFVLALVSVFVFAAAVRVFVADFLALALAPRATFIAARFPVVLEDFLRVFLDIRLPFVAFGSSTIGLLRFSLAGKADSQSRRWASLIATEYGDKEFDALSVRSLKGLLIGCFGFHLASVLAVRL